MPKQVIFLENRAQVLHAMRSLQLGAEIWPIAVTSEALQTLEELDIPHSAVCDFADTRKLVKVDEELNLKSFELVREIESFIAERYAPARFDGPSFLTGQGYQIQMILTTVLTRIFLISESIKACKPEVVFAFGDDIELLIAGSGYDINPWWRVIAGMCDSMGILLEQLPSAKSSDKKWSFKGLIRKISEYRLFKKHATSYRLSRCSARLLDGKDKQNELRLLLIDKASIEFDWGGVLATLGRNRKASCYCIAKQTLDEGIWMSCFDPYLEGLSGALGSEFDIQPPAFTDIEVQDLLDLFDEWKSNGIGLPKLKIMDYELFEVIEPCLRIMSSRGPALLRHADEVARRALDYVSPDAVCFFAIYDLPTKRMAYQCRLRGVPTVSYQHGGTYGTHAQAGHGQLDTAYADYFLSYGCGIIPWRSDVFPLRSLCVPVGSARLESLKRGSVTVSLENESVVTVAWVSDITMRNTFCGTFQFEDTERYRHQKECLSLLENADGINIIYRPHRNVILRDGITRWIQEDVRCQIKVDATNSLSDVIREADVVISDCTGDTAWKEILLQGKPLVLYCDPEQTRILPHFAKDIELSCHWCRSRADLLSAVRRLVSERGSFVEILRKKDAREFVLKYVLHRDDGRCVHRVVSFLSDVCARGVKVDEWAASQYDAEQDWRNGCEGSGETL